ncbi:MAG: TonB-dependent receptor [Gemmatimonadetes bacterium]|nr:TonB-dependent receptor [Gemmatimonadota bacterium]
MKPKNVLAGVLAAAVGLTTATAAQEEQDTTRLEDVTVTATRIPVSANALASSVTVLQGADLHAQGIRNVLDALRSVPGLNIVQGGSFGAATSLFLRGGESDYVQVLVDGVPVNDPGGSYNLANLTTTNVERIEVLRGPASVLYGSDATVGVVQIITKRGEGPFRVTAGANAGTYGSVGFDVDVSGATDRTRYSLGVERFFTNGSYDFNNDFDNAVVSGRFDVRPNDATDLSLTLRYQDSEFHFPTDGSGNLVDRNAFSLDEATTIGVEAGRFLTSNVEARVLLASNVISRGTNDAQDDENDTQGFYAFRSIQDLSRQSIDVRTNVYLNGIVLTVGVQLEQQEERSFNESESEFGPSNGSTDVERSNQGYYAQFLANIEGLSAILGGRLDDNQEFGTFATYRAAAAYTVARTKLRASVGRSFKAPTFFENFATGFVVGNPDLDPERSLSWEVGLEQTLADGRITLRGAYFDQSFDDLIQFSFTEVPNYKNIAEAKASGVEIEANVVPVPDFVIGANYTYLDTDVIDAGFDSGDGATFVEGKRLLRRPSTTLNVTAMYRGWDRGVVSAAVNHVGDRDDRDFATFPATPVVLPTYTTVDLAAQIELFPQQTDLGLTWTLRVENVFDKQYVEVFGFPARRRTIFVGGRVGR